MAPALGAVGCSVGAPGAGGSGGADAPPRPQRLAGKISVSYWASGAQGEVILKDMARFTQAYQEVQVDPVYLSPYLDKLTVLLSSGTPPDVVGVQLGQASSLAPSLADLGPYVRRDAREVGEPDFWPAAWSQTKHAGHQVTLPQGNASTAMLFYNADLFRNAAVKTPAELYEAKQWTWDAFRDAAVRLTKRTGDTAGQLGAELPPSFPWALPFIWTLGGEVFDAEHKQATVALAKTIDALQRLADLHQRDQSVWVPGGDMGAFLDWERPGKVGMAPSWDARTAIWRTTAYRWDIAPLPRGAGGETTILQIDANGVARESRAPELAWTFVREWTGKERALPRLLDMGQYPARKSLADPWKEAMAPKAPPANLKYFDALAKSARPVPPVAQWSRVAAVWDKHAPQVYLGRVTAREGAEVMTREMNEILAG